MSPEQLFPRPGGDFLALLAGLPEFLDAAMPLRRQHRRELPRDIRELSHLLTDERGDLRRDYLADPAALSAYMRYFLPWNIYRLGVLFSGLALDPGGEDPGAGATVIDLGTGPLTAPLALWMSRPHLRRRALSFVCVDRAPKPMRLGLDTLRLMAEARGQGLPPWKVTLVKSPLDARLREKADLVIMANALNEVLHRGEGVDLGEDAGALAWHLSSMLTERGQLLVVEPGVRPSAHLLAALRRGLLHQDMKPLAPCPHTGPCPMSGRGYTAWCHFNFESDPAPAWLRKLSELARLPKDNVSLSFLHFSRKGRSLEAPVGRSLVRAVSGPLELPGTDPMGGSRRYGQYACSERGLTLLSLPRKHQVPLPGTLIEASWPEIADIDPKSGAVVLPLGDATRPTPAGPRAEQIPAPVNEAKPPKAPRLPSQRPQERAGQRANKPRTAAKSGSKAEPLLIVDGELQGLADKPRPKGADKPRPKAGEAPPPPPGLKIGPQPKRSDTPKKSGKPRKSGPSKAQRSGKAAPGKPGRNAARRKERKDRADG